MLITLLSASRAAGALEASAVVTWGIPLGVLVSCGLAVAAGFCSFFPHLIWMALAGLGLGLIAQTPAHAWGTAAIYAGLVATLAGLLLQVWRVRTGRFRPTIRTTNHADATTE
jgi:RsiW-degrading membrane proteinase PrsW (M82 family)